MSKRVAKRGVKRYVASKRPSDEDIANLELPTLPLTNTVEQANLPASRLRTQSHAVVDLDGEATDDQGALDGSSRYWTLEERVRVIRLREVEKWSWRDIANVLTDRSPEAIRSHYKVYLRRATEIGSWNWSAAEEKTLIQARADDFSWDHISSILTRRPVSACMRRYEQILTRVLKPTWRQWSHAESEILQTALAKGHDYAKFGHRLPGRSKDACERQLIRLQQNQGPPTRNWSQDEQELLVYSRLERALIWEDISLEIHLQLGSTRSSDACRIHFNKIIHEVVARSNNVIPESSSSSEAETTTDANTNIFNLQAPMRAYKVPTSSPRLEKSLESRFAELRVPDFYIPRKFWGIRSIISLPSMNMRSGSKRPRSKTRSPVSIPKRQRGRTGQSLSAGLLEDPLTGTDSCSSSEINIRASHKQNKATSKHVPTTARASPSPPISTSHDCNGDPSTIRTSPNSDPFLIRHTYSTSATKHLKWSYERNGARRSTNSNKAPHRDTTRQKDRVYGNDCIEINSEPDSEDRSSSEAPSTPSPLANVELSKDRVRSYPIVHSLPSTESELEMPDPPPLTDVNPYSPLSELIITTASAVNSRSGLVLNKNKNEMRTSEPHLRTNVTRHLEIPEPTITTVANVVENRGAPVSSKNKTRAQERHKQWVGHNKPESLKLPRTPPVNGQTKLRKILPKVRVWVRSKKEFLGLAIDSDWDREPPPAFDWEPGIHHDSQATTVSELATRPRGAKAYDKNSLDTISYGALAEFVKKAQEILLYEDKELTIQTSTLYRQHHAHGPLFLNEQYNRPIAIPENLYSPPRSEIVRRAYRILKKKKRNQRPHDDIVLLIGIHRKSSDNARNRREREAEYTRLTHRNDELCSWYMTEIHQGNACCQPERFSVAYIAASNSDLQRKDIAAVEKMRARIDQIHAEQEGKIVLICSQTDGFATNLLSLFDYLRPFQQKGLRFELVVFWTFKSAYVFDLQRLRNNFLSIVDGKISEDYYFRFITTMTVVAGAKETIAGATRAIRQERVFARNNLPISSPSMGIRIVLKRTSDGNFIHPKDSRKSFKTRAELLAALFASVTAMRTPACPICHQPLSSRWTKTIRHHLHDHFPENIECKFCEEISPYQPEHAKHMRDYHPEEYSAGREAEAHRPTYTCACKHLGKRCDETFDNVDAFHQHTISKHEEWEKEAVWQCQEWYIRQQDFCGKAHRSWKQLSRHIDLVHTPEYLRACCTSCGKYYKSVRAMLRHQIKYCTNISEKVACSLSSPSDPCHWAGSPEQLWRHIRDAHNRHDHITTLQDLLNIGTRYGQRALDHEMGFMDSGDESEPVSVDAPTKHPMLDVDDEAAWEDSSDQEYLVTNRRPGQRPGFRNPRAFCYINSICQTLFTITPLRQRILGMSIPRVLDDPRASCLRHLKEILRDLGKASTVPLEPKSFASHCARLDNGRWDGQVCQDPHEFMIFLLGLVQQGQHYTITQTWGLDMSIEPAHEICCLVHTRSFCEDCGTAKMSLGHVEKNSFLPLYFPTRLSGDFANQIVSLDELLRYYFRANSQIHQTCPQFPTLYNQDDDNNAAHNYSTRQSHLEEMPPFLMCHFVRHGHNSVDGHHKISTRVRPQLTLNLSEYQAPNFARQTDQKYYPRYELVADVRHIGAELATGHVRVFCRTEAPAPDDWILFDDKHVSWESPLAAFTADDGETYLQVWRQVQIPIIEV